MDTLRTELRNELTERLVPLLLAQGFSGPSKIKGNSLFHEFTRKNANRIETLNIQFEKRQSPRFIINLKIEIAENIEHPGLEDIKIITCRVADKKKGGSTRSWFCADQPWYLRILGYKKNMVNEAVSKAIDTISEIELWWENPTRSEHIRYVTAYNPISKEWTAL